MIKFRQSRDDGFRYKEMEGRCEKIMLKTEKKEVAKEKINVLIFMA